jgi:hypothetical protein
MSKALFAGIATLATALATVATAVAASYSEGCTGTTALPEPEKPTEAAPEKPKRGRPAGSTNADKTPEPAKEPEPAREPEPMKEPEPTKEPEKPEGALTLEQLQALVKPVVEDGGEPAKVAVKAAIAKYGVTNLSGLAGKPECHAAFAKDLEMLSM